MQQQVLHARKFESLGLVTSGVAHSFSNDLQAILGYTELLGMDIPRGTDTRLLLDRTVEVAKKAGKLIEQLLAYSGQRIFRFRPVDVNAVLGDMAREIGAAPSHGKVVRFRYQRDLPLISGDPAQLRRLTANLVANALRYTEHGRVLIGARRVGDKLIRVEVRDTGKGIPEEFQERIFEEYFQLENPERHRDKGLGLGLAIVSRLANLLGGHVSVRSHPGRGSCFHLQVARCSAAAQRMAASLPASPGFALPLEHALVAVIDDDEAILEAMAEVFDHWGVGLAAGVDAEQVRDELVALGRAPDIILCDYRLRSGHTGIEAVHLLRQAFGADIAAALLTGDTAPDTIQAIDASGLPVLHKPLKPAKLRAFLSHLLATPPGQPAHKSFEQ